MTPWGSRQSSVQLPTAGPSEIRARRRALDPCRAATDLCTDGSPDWRYSTIAILVGLIGELRQRGHPDQRVETRDGRRPGARPSGCQASRDLRRRTPSPATRRVRLRSKCAVVRGRVLCEVAHRRASRQLCTASRARHAERQSAMRVDINCLWQRFFCSIAWRSVDVSGVTAETLLVPDVSAKDHSIPRRSVGDVC